MPTNQQRRATAKRKLERQLERRAKQEKRRRILTIAGGAVPNNGPDDLKAWIMDPPAKKPGTQMPKLGLTDEEATRITTFLETLK